MSQDYKNWEWIIMLNNGAKYESHDDRIKIFESSFASDSVGFLKRLACMQATGEVIAEVDHDDLITPDCLGKVVKAFEDKEVGFVYSRNAKLTDKPPIYMPEWGWTADEFTYKGKKLYAPFNQPVYPGRLGHIYFAPDHIRTWRRSVYEDIGGYDDRLAVCDDLDLMHRLYKVTKFKEIPEVLYLYRMNGSNTYVKRGKLIRDMNVRIYDRHIEDLARRWAQLNSLAIIELPPALRAVPLRGDENPDGSLLKQYGDNSAGVVFAKEVLHMYQDTMGVMQEIHRVLAPGGLLISETPSTDGRGAFADPEAKSLWNENSFWYYTQEKYAKRTGNTCMFRECKLTTQCRDDFGREHREAFVIAHLEKLI